MRTLVMFMSLFAFLSSVAIGALDGSIGDAEKEAAGIVAFLETKEVEEPASNFVEGAIRSVVGTAQTLWDAGQGFYDSMKRLVLFDYPSLADPPFSYVRYFLTSLLVAPLVLLLVERFAKR